MGDAECRGAELRHLGESRLGRLVGPEGGADLEGKAVETLLTTMSSMSVAWEMADAMSVSEPMSTSNTAPLQ